MVAPKMRWKAPTNRRYSDPPCCIPKVSSISTALAKVIRRDRWRVAGVGPHNVGFRRHWKEEYALLQSDFEKLLAERRNATQRAGGETTPSPGGDAESKRPVAQLQPVAAASPGRTCR